ncbi:alpha-galactosidase [Reinekea marinisedimentorum]|uniref:Alpha-galactosidase n=1 Tax=Reinekea marinisedimentorum TaxID=230495 RepID=A0A4R3I2F4_9GAMM|nr:alpha-galactosidase [Reinekea marinisedimentorum]TCS39966.1 alpha-galactosidase [Reinekea marinisedimentorum]
MPILHSKNCSIAIIDRSGTPSICYIGERLSDATTIDALELMTTPPVPQGGLDTSPILTIAPTYADHSFMTPAVAFHSNGKHWATQWKIQESESTDSSVIYKLLDEKTGVVLSWSLDVCEQTNVFTIRSELINKGDSTLELSQCLATVPLPARMNEVTSFTGRWVHEFQPVDTKIPFGCLEFTNRKGRTSHDHFPGLLVTDDRVTEASGECFAFHLGWSGNHCQRVERSQNGLTQYQAGIELVPGEVTLHPGDKFEAAPLYFTYSRKGLAGVAESLQPFVRQNILDIPGNKPRPVHINTWEAIYFDHRQQELDSLAAAGELCGAERFVLDDGWFPARRDDSAGLGDWTVDKTVYPKGLHPLKATLQKHNLGFGIWFEPEMVNKDSELYRNHPEWLLQVNGLKQTAGRNQWVLDITRPEVRDYLYKAITNILNEYPIEYIKWDMNRDLSQSGNPDGKPAYYRYVRSLYELIDRIRSSHPAVEIESCASGGGRIDYGILKRTHRFWLSDCNDANERQTMQQWASLFFPAEVLGSHVGPVISHTTSRAHSTAVRAGTALFGHMGIEWDVRKLNEDELNELSSYIQLYKDLRTHIHSGIRIPLAAPDKNQLAFMVSDADVHLVSLYQRNMPNSGVPGNLLLPMLEAEKKYRIKVLSQPAATHHLMKVKTAWQQLEDTVVSGEVLAKVGIPLPVMDPETVLILQFNRL